MATATGEYPHPTQETKNQRCQFLTRTPASGPQVDLQCVSGFQCRGQEEKQALHVPPSVSTSSTCGPLDLLPSHYFKIPRKAAYNSPKGKSEITQGHYITLWVKSPGSVRGGRRHLVAGDRQGSFQGGPQGVNSFRRVSQLTSRDGSADFPEEADFFLVPSSWNGMVALLWRSELM